MKGVLCVSAGSEGVWQWRLRLRAEQYWPGQSPAEQQVRQMSGVEQVRENLASLAGHLHDNDILRWTMAEVGTELCSSQTWCSNVSIHRGVTGSWRGN